MEHRRTIARKLMEWVRRYLPCEIAGTVGELGGAAVAYWLTGSMAAAAITATVGASAGYYAAAFTNAVRWAYRDHSGLPVAARLVVANMFALRSVAIEFGPAELIDSIAIRPLAYYLGPALFDSVAAGWIFAKLFSDIGFYLVAILSYERFKGLLAGRRRIVEEVDGGPVAAIAPA
ncbi:hypothetical protein DVS77_28865 [Mycolicibacterium moriokaense]|nr:hypothetical protein DVS77_28865 [Mycolicibacterium moriokaense]